MALALPFSKRRTRDKSDGQGEENTFDRSSKTNYGLRGNPKPTERRVSFEQSAKAKANKVSS